MRRFRYLIIALLIGLDQLTKLLVRDNMQIGDSIPLISDFFSLTYVSNRGGAMSSFEGNTLLLVCVPIIALIFALYYMEKHKAAHPALLAAIELVVAGGVGNLIDRLCFGYVTDFLDFTELPLWNWVFNVADIAICSGCFILILYVLFFDRSDKNSGVEK